MIKIAICDDDRAICEQIEKIIEKHTDYIDVYYTGEDFLQKLKNGIKYDIIFLDIELNSINGVEIGHIIRWDLNDQITQIVYISSKENYAMQLFKIRPADFLVKPFNNNEIENVFYNLSRLLEEYTIKFKIGHDIDYIRTKDIRYISSEARKMRIVTVDNTQEVYGKLDDYFDEFQRAGLVRIHKSCVINPFHLSKYTNDYVVIDDGTELNISKPYRTKVRQQLMSIWRQKNDKFLDF